MHTQQAPRPAAGGARATVRPKVLKLVRRVHLYAGLFLLPFVFAYGLSGYLFNHPTVLRTNAPADFGPEVLAETGFADGIDAAAIADEVVRQLRGEPVDGVPPDLVLADAAGARLTGSIELKARCDENEHTIRVDGDGDGGQLIAPAARRPAPPPAPFARKDGLEVAAPLLDRWRADGGVVAERLGLHGARVQLERAPRVLFDIAADGRTWHATYDPMKGSLSAVPADAPGRDVSFRSLMTSLHGARGYSTQGGVRWFWGLQVDAVGILMMVWAVTGLVMWWQQKRLRRPGLVVLGASAVSAWLLISGMYEQFAG